MLAPDGQVTDFSALEWGGGTGRWCNAHGLDGAVFGYSGAAPNAATAAVDMTARNLRFNFTVASAGYAGGGLSFDSCVNATGFNAIQFTAAITAGSLNGCIWIVALQTQDQRPITATMPTGGTCDSSTTTCYNFPAVANLTVPGATATPYTALFTLFSNPSQSTIPTRTQIVGVQWQVQSSAGGTCTVELRVDDIKFISLLVAAPAGPFRRPRRFVLA